MGMSTSLVKLLLLQLPISMMRYSPRFAYMYLTLPLSSMEAIGSSSVSSTGAPPRVFPGEMGQRERELRQREEELKRRETQLRER